MGKTGWNPGDPPGTTTIQDHIVAVCLPSGDNHCVKEPKLGSITVILLVKDEIAAAADDSHLKH